MIKTSSIRKAAAHRARIGEVKNIFMFVKQADDEAASRVVVTDYHKGFLTKCAELGVDNALARQMLKAAQQQSLFGRVGNWIDKGLDKTVGAAARWAGGNWDKSIKPALGTAAGAALGTPLGPAGMIAGGMLGRSMSKNPGMQPVQPGAKAIQQGGKIVNPREIAERYAKQKGWNTNSQTASQPQQNGVNNSGQSQADMNAASAATDYQWNALNGMSGQNGQTGGMAKSSPGQQNPALQPLPTTDQAQAGLQLQHGRFWNSVPSSPYRTLSTGRKPVDPTRDGFTQGMRYPRVSRQRIATPREGVGGDPTVNMDF